MTTYEVRAALKNHARLSQLIYPAQQVRAHEQAAAEACGLSLYQLMELAGQAVFEHIQVTYPDKRHWLVCCGKGNNGGDGWVVARLAHQQGLRVEIWTLCPPEQLSGDAAQAYRTYLDAGGPAPQIAAPQPWRGELIVDAILGNNVQGPVREPQLSAIDWINQQTEKVVSIDLPSGLAADSGATVPVAIQADSTITLVAHKLAPLTGAGRQLAGQITLASLTIQDAFARLAAPVAQHFSWRDLPILPARSRHAHKGNHGHLLCVGSHRGMPGALALSGEAALRSGAGLVKLDSVAEHLPIYASRRAEWLLGTEQDLSQDLSWMSKLLLGPGLGQSDWSSKLFEQCLQFITRNPLPLLIDADGLNLLADSPQTLSHDCVLTPHPKEAARLLGCSVAQIERDRLQAAIDIARKYQAICLLKGAGTIITDGDQHFVCAGGNPGMAVAGMGDVLSGIIAGLMAQGLTAFDAALFGCAVHAEAADRIARNRGERGILAADLFDQLPVLINHAVTTHTSQ